MKVQSTQSLAEQMLQAQTQTTAPLPETAFHDLLSGAIQSQSQTPATKQPEQAPSGETHTPAKDAAPSQNAKPEQTPAAEADSTEQAPDDATLQNAVAMVIVPQIIALPDQEAQELPIVNPVQAAPVEAPTIETMQAAPTQTLPIETQPVAQEAAAQETPQTQPAPLPDTPQQENSGDGILSAELIEESVTPPLTEHPLVVEAAPDSESQSRFDAMIQDAANKLQGKEPVTDSQEEAPIVTEAAPESVARTANRAIPAELKRKSEVSEETLSMAPAHTVEVKAEQPELQTQVPEQAEAPVPTPAKQVETQVTQQLEEGRMEFHMQLNPHELGRVNVKMVLEDGKLAVQIAATSEKALDALRKESDGLMASLRMQGIQVETVNVVSETQTASGHMESPFGMAMGQQQDGGTAGQGSATKNGGSYAQSGDAPIEATPQEAEPDRLLDTAV